MDFLQNIVSFLDNYLPQFVADKLGPSRSSKAVLLFNILRKFKLFSFRKHIDNKLFYDKLQHYIVLNFIQMRKRIEHVKSEVLQM